MPALPTSAANGSVSAYPASGAARAASPLPAGASLQAGAPLPAGSSLQAGSPLATAALRHIDIPLVVVAAPLAIALGAPSFGCAVAAVAWVLQSILAHTDRRWIARRREPGSRLGLDVAESFARIWLLAGAIVIAGAVGDRSDGLAAALTVFAVYSVAFAVRMSRGRQGFER